MTGSKLIIVAGKLRTRAGDQRGQIIQNPEGQGIEYVRWALT